MGRYSSHGLKAFLNEGGARLVAGSGSLVHGFLAQMAPLDIVAANAATSRHQPPLLNPLLRH